jgi:hypothetical protein
MSILPFHSPSSLRSSPSHGRQRCYRSSPTAPTSPSSVDDIMELRSGRRLSSQPPSIAKCRCRPRRDPSHGGGIDHISSLLDDLLLLVLARLRCARAASHTSLLSRRWRGLWWRLPELIFREVGRTELSRRPRAAHVVPRRRRRCASPHRRV